MEITGAGNQAAKTWNESDNGSTLGGGGETERRSANNERNWKIKSNERDEKAEINNETERQNSYGALHNSVTIDRSCQVERFSARSKVSANMRDSLQETE
ncbi:hypothetical protein QLX08_001441 [Tetragonisca angustula]|uniref:Uncharacterized protein n=1 Tax=Tetragonisca angustula TaxID=166442 RepID=A0AAW1AEP6_9HYME